MQRIAPLLVSCVLAAAPLAAQSYPFDPLDAVRRGSGELRRGGDDRTELVEAEVHLRAGGVADLRVSARRDEFRYSGTWRKDRGDYIKLAIDRADGEPADASGWILVEKRRFERIEIDGRTAGGHKLALSFRASGPDLPLPAPPPPVATATPAPGPTPVPEELFTEEFGYDQPGADLRAALASTLADCQRLCAAEPECRAYTFNSRDQRCYLKSEERPLVRRADCVTGVRRAPVVERDGFLERPDFVIEGGDYTSVYLRTADECRDACRRDGECRAYTYDAGPRMCYLKDRPGTYRPRPGALSGEKARRSVF